MTSDHTHDEFADDPCLDAGFGLDPYVLPQFDLLVADGRITREFADSVITERRAAGLAMTPSELRARPAPLLDTLAWLAQYGGPEIRVDSHPEVEINGLKWSWYGTSRSITHHIHVDERGHVGWYELHKAYDDKGVSWAVQHRVLTSLDTKKNIYTRQTGRAQSVQEAIAEAKAARFEPEVRGGISWYPHEGGEMAIIDSEQVTLRELHQTHLTDDMRWLWERQHAVGLELGELFGNQFLKGRSATRESAEAAALKAPALLKIAAARLLGDDRFEAGRQAGRAEIKAQIAGLSA